MAWTLFFELVTRDWLHDSQLATSYWLFGGEPIPR
jgi:hypothetical protein